MWNRVLFARNWFAMPSEVLLQGHRTFCTALTFCLKYMILEGGLWMPHRAGYELGGHVSVSGLIALEDWNKTSDKAI
jgi:hypothetical protein